MDVKIDYALRPNLVRPMRASWILASLLVGCVLLWPAHAYTADKDSVGKAYTAQATDVARRVVLAELVKHPERIHRMSMKCTFQVDKQGHPHSVKVVSSPHNQWAEDTARRALASAKFPPLPKTLIEQSGSDLARIEYKIDLDEPR
jgi:TonB family protein